jgi:4-hydroxybenzoate polyprenyltransferase
MRQRIALYRDLIRWDRPAGWLLLLWPTLSALWLAAGGFPGWHLLAVFVLGTILMRSAGCCINDVADRNFDRHVQRTAQRPVTRGAISVPEALAVGAALAIVAFLLVFTLRNAVVLGWSLAALLVAIAYPFAKRFIAMPQAVLGLAFSFGIPMAYAAVQQDVPLQAAWLMLGNALWVLAYDTEYAMVDRDDDLKIGIQTSAITLGSWDVTAVMGFYVGFLAIWMGQLVDVLSAPVWWLTLSVCVAQVLWHGYLIRGRTRVGCFRAFQINHWLGLVLFVSIWLSLDVRLI